MRRISRTRSVPREVGHAQRRRVLRPVDHVGGREDAPVLELVAALVTLVVMPREQPQRVARDHSRRISRMLVADDGVARGLEFVFSPALAQGIHLLSCQGYDAAVARMEILVEGAGDRVETVEVVACLVLVAARGVEVVHQYVTLFAVELEYARPLDGCLARIGVQIDEILLPRAAQRRGGGLLYAVLHFAALVVLGVALVEEMPRAVLADDVVVDGAVFGAEEHLRLGLEAAEVVVGVGVVCHKAAHTLAVEGEVDHVFAGFGVEDRLRRPYPVCVAEVLGIGLGKVDV